MQIRYQQSDLNHLKFALIGLVSDLSTDMSDDRKNALRIAVDAISYAEWGNISQCTYDNYWLGKAIKEQVG